LSKIVRRRHPGEGRDPAVHVESWIPAFAGTTEKVSKNSLPRWQAPYDLLEARYPIRPGTRT